MGRLTDAAAKAIVGAGRAVARALPARVRKDLDDRLFYTIFQKTRVENDAYGWRPPAPGGGAGATKPEGPKPEGPPPATPTRTVAPEPPPPEPPVAAPKRRG